jgi:nucleoside-diphosphate-sugar epimerase
MESGNERESDLAMAGEHVLVTGASGFTGGRLCRRLVERGYAVRALIRHPDRDCGLSSSGVKTVLGDLRDQRSLQRAVDGIDKVFHIAAVYRKENVSRREMFEINVQGTRNLLDASIEAGVRRFMHCSTTGVHGDIKHPPANEESPFAPGDHYQESKAEGERVVMEYMRNNQLPIVIFRPGGIYGPGDLRFLKLFKAIKARRFAMIGSGEVRNQLIYIDDLIDGILLCATAERAVGNVYILAGDEPATLNQLVHLIAQALEVQPTRLRIPFTPVYLAGFVCEMICRPLGLDPLLHRRRVKFFSNTRWFDISKAKTQLGFKPRIDFRTGLGCTARWYQKQGFLCCAVAAFLSVVFL